jgi:hypothetical protein
MLYYNSRKGENVSFGGFVPQPLTHMAMATNCCAFASVRLILYVA